MLYSIYMQFSQRVIFHWIVISLWHCWKWTWHLRTALFCSFNGCLIPSWVPHVIMGTLINQLQLASSSRHWCLHYRTTTGSAPTYLHSLLRIYIPSRSPEILLVSNASWYHHREAQITLQNILVHHPGWWMILPPLSGMLDPCQSSSNNWNSSLSTLLDFIINKYKYFPFFYIFIFSLPFSPSLASLYLFEQCLKGAFTPDVNDANRANDLHVKSMQRRSCGAIRASWKIWTLADIRAALTNQELALAVTSITSGGRKSQTTMEDKCIVVVCGYLELYIHLHTFTKTGIHLQRDWSCLAEAPPMTRIRVCCVVNFTREWREFLARE